MTPSGAAPQPPAPTNWPTLHPTTQSAYNEILWKGGLPRIEIARKLGVSRTRLTAITRDLESAGLIAEGGREQRSSTGRPAEMLVARPDRFHFLGLHLNGENVVVAVVDLQNRVVWERQTRIPGPTVDAVLQLCRTRYAEACAAGFKVAGIAVCVPARGAGGGPAVADLGDDTHRRPLQAACGVPVWVEDDVVALTAFEQWPCLADGQDSMVLISLGPEIGFGLVTDRKIVTGAHHAAGRFGHVRVDSGGDPCPLGHRGCLWSTSSTVAITTSVPGATCVQDVAARVADGDPQASAVLERAAYGLGVAAGHVVNLLDPDKLVLTGDSHTLLQGRLGVLRSAMASVVLTGADVEIDIAALDFVEWARAAAAFALYRTLSQALP